MLLFHKEAIPSKTLRAHVTSAPQEKAHYLKMKANDLWPQNDFRRKKSLF